MPHKPETIQARNINNPASRTTINAERYRAMRTALLKTVPRSPEGIAFRALPAAVKKHLRGGRLPGGGSLMWYITVVKLDLEARGLLRRIPDSTPQRIRRV